MVGGRGRAEGCRRRGRSKLNGRKDRRRNSKWRRIMRKNSRRRSRRRGRGGTNGGGVGERRYSSWGQKV